MHGALVVLRIMARKFEFRDEEDRAPLAPLIDATFPVSALCFERGRGATHRLPSGCLGATRTHVRVRAAHPWSLRSSTPQCLLRAWIPDRLSSVCCYVAFPPQALLTIFQQLLSSPQTPEVRARCSPRLQRPRPAHRLACAPAHCITQPAATGSMAKDARACETPATRVLRARVMAVVVFPFRCACTPSWCARPFGQPPTWACQTTCSCPSNSAPG